MREAMYDEANIFVRALGKKKFLGGKQPNLADLVMFYLYSIYILISGYMSEGFNNYDSIEQGGEVVVVRFETNFLIQPKFFSTVLGLR